MRTLEEQRLEPDRAVVQRNGIGGPRRQRHWSWRVGRVLGGSALHHWRMDRVEMLTDKRGSGGNSEGDADSRSERWKRRRLQEKSSAELQVQAKDLRDDDESV